MKRMVLFLSLLFLFWCSFFPVSHLYASGDRADKLQIELYGGYSLLNPWDLNQRAGFDLIYDEFNTLWKYRYYHSLLGDNFTYSGQLEAEYKKIKNAIPLGLRIRYSMTPSLSVSIGFKYLSKREESRSGYHFDVRSLNPDDVFYYNEFSITKEISPYSLFVKAYIPMVGIHYKIKSNRFLNFEAYFTFGPVFAECGFAKQQHYRDSNSYGYWYEQDDSYDIKGKGTGAAVDTGIRMNINVVKNIDLFIECGYALQGAINISGPGSIESVFNEVNSSGYSESNSWEGTWAVIGYEFNRPWGYLYHGYPSNEYPAEDYMKFKLDLSGFQIRMGISFIL
jgi:hypothetical protein